MMLALLMNVLDSTIANVALPRIQSSLSASPDELSWVLTSYIVGVAVMTPLAGWLGLKIGRKPLLLASTAAFVVLSMLCGLATNLPELVFLRFLQGVSGAAVMPLTQAALFDMWPQEFMPKVMAIWSSVLMVGPILGPSLGGFLTENLSWRWVFYINLPIGLVAFTLILLTLEHGAAGRDRKFDMLGFAALVLFTCGAQLMLDRGPGQDWFSSREIWVEAIVALCGLYVFAIQMATAKNPFFDGELFTDRNFMTSVGFQFALGAASMSATAMIPIMTQHLLGYSVMKSGFVSMSRSWGSLLAFILSPWLTVKIGPRSTVLTGVLVMAVSFYCMSGFDLSMTAQPVEVTGFFLGFGQSVIFGPLAVLAFETLAPRHRTEASVLSTVFRTIGGSMGIAIAQAALARQIAVAHEALAANIVPADPVVHWALSGLLDGRTPLEAIEAEVVRQASMLAYNSIFAWMSLASLGLLPLVLLLRADRWSKASR
jgi:DHA2 family multidrug resistance protein